MGKHSEIRMNNMSDSYDDYESDGEYGIGLYISALTVGAVCVAVLIRRSDELVVLDSETVVLVGLLTVVLGLLVAMVAG